MYSIISVILKLSLLISCSLQPANDVININRKNNGDDFIKSTHLSKKDKIDFWLTKADQSIKFEQQDAILIEAGIANNFLTIEIDDQQEFQVVEGFGFSLTGGSAEVINQLSKQRKNELLNKLFGAKGNAISISYLRLSIGASDLDSATFSYNDLAQGQTDKDLTKFSLSPDKINLIPLLKEILRINPDLKIMASPWSPPVWMKDIKSTIGGSLLPEYYDSYAQYFVKYIQQMKEEGISISAITPQNEPLHPGNNPSMYMKATDQAEFIKNHLGPAFKAANLQTKIIIYDHNCDKPEYPISILNDKDANKYIDGSAFHLYGGHIDALSKVHSEHPDKNLYFTEQYTSSKGVFKDDLKWHINNVIIGSMRNWSKVTLEWNLANNHQFAPHTNGGCDTCKGAITIIDKDKYVENVGYYIIAHASKFVPFGSVRIASVVTDDLNHVAFKTPNDRIVVIVINNKEIKQSFNIKYNNKWIKSSLDGGSVGSYIW